MESSVLERTARMPATGLGENVPLCVSLLLSVSVALVLGVDSQLFSCYGGTGCPEANSVPLPVPTVIVFHVWSCHPVPLPVPTSDRVSCVAPPPFLLLYIYRSNYLSQAFEPLSAPVSVQHLVSSPPLSIVQGLF